MIGRNNEEQTEVFCDPDWYVEVSGMKKVKVAVLLGMRTLVFSGAVLKHKFSKDVNSSSFFIQSERNNKKSVDTNE